MSLTFLSREVCSKSLGLKLPIDSKEGEPSVLYISDLRGGYCRLFQLTEIANVNCTTPRRSWKILD